MHGALRMVRSSDDGGERTVREFYRGETLGVLALLGDRPSPVDLFAVRDSTLLRLSRLRLLAIVQRHPDLLLALARAMSERAFDVLEAFVGAERAPSRRRAGNLALLPLALDPPARAATDRLIEAALAERPMAHVTAAAVDRALGPGAAAASDGDGARATAWLSDLERAAEVVLYECDPALPRWTARCRRQSDRLVIVTPSSSDPRMVADAIRRAKPDGLPRRIDLVLVHPSSAALPSGTRAWWSLDDLAGVHHVRVGHRGDVSRAARRLVGRPVGVVLSGGGARGIAHVGVLAAIADAGIPIDYACGASMGAIFAAALALGWSSGEMREAVGELFASPFALYDLTLPISSLLAGKKLDRVLRERLGEGDIEDLWLPFFCVSTDLSHARQVVHERGRLWKAVRASCSIPGIFPPLPMDGHTLVDGGLLDNLPLGLLAERCGGPIIAVDVLPYGDPTFERPRGRVARWLRELRTRIRGERASPPLFDILMRSTLVGSKFRQHTAAPHVDQVIYLDPPVESFGMLEWRAHRPLVEAGYRHAREQLARHRALFAPRYPI